jgi:hypothetical protein
MFQQPDRTLNVGQRKHLQNVLRYHTSLITHHLSHITFLLYLFYDSQVASRFQVLQRSRARSRVCNLRLNLACTFDFFIFTFLSYAFIYDGMVCILFVRDTLP